MVRRLILLLIWQNACPSAICRFHIIAVEPPQIMPSASRLEFGMMSLVQNSMHARLAWHLHKFKHATEKTP
jgi:hypothetical protein